MAETPTPAAVLIAEFESACRDSLVTGEKRVAAAREKLLAALAEQAPKPGSTQEPPEGDWGSPLPSVEMAQPVAVEAVQQPGLLKLFNEIMESIDTHRGVPVWDHARMYELRAALSAPAAPTVAPVAWEWFDQGGEHHLTLSEPADYDLPLRLTPLYAAPTVNSSETPNGSPALNSIKRIEVPAGKPDLHQFTGSDWVPVGWSVEAMAQRDKALEFAGYLAKGAEQFIEVVNRYAKAMTEITAEEEIEKAQEGLTEYGRGLRSDIYEFRKRAARAGKGEA